MYLSKRQQKVSFQEARERLGYSQETMAKALESNQTAISALESGRKIPRWLKKAIVLHRLLSKAGLTLDDLLVSFPEQNADIIGDTQRAAENSGDYA